VPVPDIPSGIGGLGRFASQVRNAIKVLRDRPVLVSGDYARPAGSHPWKVTANGDETVTVAAGRVLYWTSQVSGNFPNEPFDADSVAYAGGEVEITGSGVLKIVITTSDQEVSDDGIIWDFVYTASSLSVELDPTATGSELTIPIALVNLTDDVASVTEQILHYNPFIQLGFAFDQGV